jgi:hypothetical protein
MTPQDMYKAWKQSHKINMRVYTDEEMYVMGYESRNAEVMELISIVEELSKRLEESKPKKKVKKND